MKKLKKLAILLFAFWVLAASVGVLPSKLTATTFLVEQVVYLRRKPPL